VCHNDAFGLQKNYSEKVTRMPFITWNRQSLLVTLAVVLIIGAGAFRIFANRVLHNQLLANAQTALDGEEYSLAEELARRLITEQAFEDDARLIAAEAAAKLGANERALAYLTKMLSGRDKNARIAMGVAANICWDQGNVTEAERLLRKVLTLDPEQPFVLFRLAHLLTLTGRHWESGPMRLTLMRLDQFQFDDLLLWGNSRALLQNDELQQLRRAAPNDPLPMLGEASIAVRKNDFAAAEPLISQVIASRPDLVEARALRGNLLLERADKNAEQIAAWNRELPPAANDHPEIWVIRGLWSKQEGKAEQAVRCFWEALKRSPNHQLANYQISLALKQIGNDDAEWFSARANGLEELERMLGVLDTDRADLKAIQRTVELNQVLGRQWEVWGWSRVALLINPELTWAKDARDAAVKQLQRHTPQVMPDSDPGRRFDYSKFPMPEWVSAPKAK
jgi:tetratricopeptide (TPR) repeat protein